jgi:hypothetical protein
MLRKYRLAADKVKTICLMLDNNKDHGSVPLGLSSETLWVKRHGMKIRGLGQGVKGLAKGRLTTLRKEDRYANMVLSREPGNKH